MFRHSIDNIMREVHGEREALLKRWLDENGVQQLSIEAGEILFEKLLKIRKVKDEELHNMKIDYLARRLDHQLNPNGVRQPSREEETAIDFINSIGSLELMNRFSERVNKK